MNPTVKRLQPEDTALVLAARDLFGTALEEEVVRAHLASKRDHIFVAFASGEPAAFLRAHDLPRLDGPPKILLYVIETKLRYRRMGMARALIHALKELSRERGARNIFLLTNEANEEAMKLYAATGAKRANEDDVMWSYDL